MEQRDPTIGKCVMTMRRRRGLTQQELATMAHRSKTALNRFANGLQFVYVERLQILARLLDVSADYLLGLTPATPDTGLPPGLARRQRQEERHAATLY
jgi:transcriptional regulator with XRE-family HTH domain